MRKADEIISGAIRESVDLKEALFAGHRERILRIAETVFDAVKSGGKVMICGNGGSAADSQHMAAEFVGRYKLERRPLPAIALTTDTSALSCIANDYSFEDVFMRQTEALARAGDVLIGISTSGKSKNVEKAIFAAKKIGCTSIALLGQDGGSIAAAADISLIVPSKNTARIQEAHILIIHIICEIIDECFLVEG